MDISIAAPAQGRGCLVRQLRDDSSTPKGAIDKILEVNPSRLYAI